MNNYQIKDCIVLANKMEWINFSEYSFSNKYLFLIFQTTCEISYSGNDFFTVPPNSVIVYPPNKLHAFRKNDGDLLNSFIYFNVDKSFFAQFDFPLNQVFTISDGYANLLVHVIDEISYIVNTPFAPEKKHNIDKNIAHVFNIVNLAYAEMLKNNPNETTKLQVFSDIRHKMLENPVEYTVRAMVEGSHYSKVYFISKYKEFFNITPSQDRKKQLMGLIKSYLQSTNYSLETIANLCGIQSVSYLIRLFKSEESITPYQYRLKAARLQSLKLKDS